MLEKKFQKKNSKKFKKIPIFSQHDFQNLICCANRCAGMYHVHRISEICISLLKKILKEKTFLSQIGTKTRPKFFSEDPKFNKNLKKNSHCWWVFFKIWFFVPYVVKCKTKKFSPFKYSKVFKKNFYEIYAKFEEFRPQN